MGQECASPRACIHLAARIQTFENVKPLRLGCSAGDEIDSSTESQPEPPKPAHFMGGCQRDTTQRRRQRPNFSRCNVSCLVNATDRDDRQKERMRMRLYRVGRDSRAANLLSTSLKCARVESDP
jgi:hypothetical protein